MLKFFRRIRWKLIDKGNLKRYILYAIGEVLLVVIGILIALQINTFHQNQTNSKEARVYLERIVEDLKADLDEVKECNESHAKRSKLILKSLNVLKSPNIEQIKNEIGFHKLMSYDSSTQDQEHPFGSNLAYIARYRTFETSDIAFDELVSTGKLNFIKDVQLKEKIQKHYIRVREKAGFQRYLNQYMREYSNIIIKNDISNQNQETEEEILLRIKYKPALITSLENVINISLRTYKILSYGENSVENSTLSLIKTIELHLRTGEYNSTKN